MLRPDHLKMVSNAESFRNKHMLVRAVCPQGHASLVSIIRAQFVPGMSYESECLATDEASETGESCFSPTRILVAPVA